MDAIRIGTVGTIIEYDHKILLLQRASEPYQGCWEIPSGRFDEKIGGPMAFALKNVNDLTGIILGTTDSFKFVHQFPIGSGNLYYLLSATRGSKERVILTSQHRGHKWANQQEALETLPLVPDLDDYIREYLKFTERLKEQSQIHPD
jgi:ADP-ribose pyrophosphatase YjhB (NUDIX family)